MRFWPFAKAEVRQQDYSDAVVAAILANAQGDVIAGGGRRVGNSGRPMAAGFQCSPG